jgi:hypothetical protein
VDARQGLGRSSIFAKLTFTGAAGSWDLLPFFIQHRSAEELKKMKGLLC